MPNLPEYFILYRIKKLNRIRSIEKLTCMKLPEIVRFFFIQSNGNCSSSFIHSVSNSVYPIKSRTLTWTHPCSLYLGRVYEFEFLWNTKQKNSIRKLNQLIDIINERNITIRLPLRPQHWLNRFCVILMCCASGASIPFFSDIGSSGLQYVSLFYSNLLLCRMYTSFMYFVLVRVSHTNPSFLGKK